jgi:Cu-Zn family superoxide dismutase
MLTSVLGALLSMATPPASSGPSGPVSVPMYQLDSKGSFIQIGKIDIADSQKGLILTPKLKGLAPGPHGFHVHEYASCAPAEKDGKNVVGLSAGGHYDPKGTKKHAGPNGEGHLGDLPTLVVAPDGSANQPVTAPRLKLSDLRGRSIVIHAGGDNYSDSPKPLGGGGARIACGIVP